MPGALSGEEAIVRMGIRFLFITLIRLEQKGTTARRLGPFPLSLPHRFQRKSPDEEDLRRGCRVMWDLVLLAWAREERLRKNDATC